MPPPPQLRPLSIEEYARIQQFPDSWTFNGRLETIYKQIGNAVHVGLGQAVGQQIMRFINGQTSANEEARNKIPYSRYKKTTDRDFAIMFGQRTYNLTKTL